MKKNLVSLVSMVCLVGLVSLTSCKKDQTSDGTQFKATTESCTSRNDKIALDGIDIKWVEGDQIAVYGTAGGGIFAAEPNTSAVTAVFNNVSGAIGAGPYRAFYPATLTTDGVNIVLPTTQTSPDGSLTALPMYAESNTNVLGFKNLCGVLKLSLTEANTNVSSISIMTTTNINGTYSIDNSGAYPVIAHQSGGCNTTTLNITTPQSIDEGGDFYIYMPAGSYSMKILISTDDNRYCIKTSNVNIGVERSQYSSIVFDDEDMDFVYYSSTLDFSGTIAESGWNIGSGQYNRWYIANGTMFISDDGGVTNEYGPSPSRSWAWKEITLPAGRYEISYDWKCLGEGTHYESRRGSAYDYLRVFLIPSSTTLNDGESISGLGTYDKPLSWICLSYYDEDACLLGQNTWQSISNVFTMYSGGSYYAAGTYKLAFLWVNDGSVCNTPPAAVKNIKIRPASSK